METTINKILCQYDFMMTGCNENEGMEDEYMDVAAVLIGYIEESGAPGKPLGTHQLRKAFDDCFEDNILEEMGVSEKSIQKCIGDINRQLLSLP